ncbi:GPP34 family phosphoprotein [Oerskovia sp. M15]
MLIIEDYLLLVLDDVTGKPVGDSSYLQQIAGGALLVELATKGRVDLVGDTSGWRSGRVVVRDESPTGSALLDEALVTIKSKEGSTPKSLVPELARSKPANAALDGLAARGLLRREEGRILGIFPTTRWPAADSRHEGELRGTLARVLLDGGAPDERTGALVAILTATRQAGRVMSAGAPHGFRAAGRGPSGERDLGRQLGCGVTRRYIEEITAATTAAITTTVVIAGAQA